MHEQGFPMHEQSYLARDERLPVGAVEASLRE
jgi:hypothetical protein